MSGASLDYARKMFINTYGEKQYILAKNKVVELLLNDKRHQNTIKYLSAWNSSKNLSYNARLLGIHIDSARCLCKRYGLTYLDGRLKHNGGGSIHKKHTRWVKQGRGERGRWASSSKER